MPITVIVPTASLGPGLQLSVQTDFIGPIATDAFWRVTLRQESDEEQLIQWDVPGLPPIVSGFAYNLILPLEVTTWTGIKLGAPCIAQVELVETGSTVIDEGTSAALVVYDDGSAWILQSQQQTGGGLTEEQAQQLAAIDRASSFAQVTDALTLTELTRGPTGVTLVAHLTTVTFGIIVRLTQIPAGLEPQTPDQQYWVKTLATVRLFRGNDLWLRVPIHTPTKIVPLEKEGLTIWVANLTLSTWLLNIELLVDFLPGVEGQVYQMHFP